MNGRGVSKRLCVTLFIISCNCGSGTAFADAVNLAKVGSHTADQNADGQISLSELLRVIQFFNLRGYHCDAAGEDGFAPGPGDATCAAHDSDYDPRDWSISLSELLRLIQFYNFRAYHACPGEGTEDDYCPGLPQPDTTPPGNVSSFVALAGDGQVALSWINPGDEDLAGVRIVRGMDAYPASWSDGVVVYEGLDQACIDTGLTNGTPCFYAAYAYDEAPNYASGVLATATPTVPEANPEVLNEFTGLRGDIDGIPPAALDPAAAQDLVDKLGEAEEEYRGGDPCAASQTMEDYLNAVQGLRTSETQPLVEDLFNRGHMIRYGMAASMLTHEGCPGVARIGESADAALDEEASDNTQAVADIRFGEPKMQTIHANGEVFTRLMVPGADPFTGAPGKPAVPVFRRLIAAPRGATSNLQTEFGNTRTIRMNLLPAQYQPVDQEPPEVDPEVFADRAFVKDDILYATNAPYPPEPVSLTDLGYCRDLHVLLLEVAAGQYNPATGEFTLFDSLHTEVHFTGGDAFLTEAALGPFEGINVYRGAVLNAADVFQFIEPGQIAPTALGEELLILTPPALRAEAQRLADWKNEKGIVTNVFDVIDGDGPGPDSPQGIDVFIEHRYENMAIRPSYILLFGDSDRVPTFYKESALGAYFLGSETIATDWPYACVSGEDFELLPEFAVGRIPVDTLAEAAIVVDKIINYEQTPPQGAAFYTHAAIAAQFQCCRNDVTTPGTDSRTFIEAAEFARDAMVPNGKLVDRIYKKTGGSGVTPARYYDGGLLPNDLGAASGFEWNGSSDDITAAWNEGRFLIIHRDHGSYYSWVHPYFSTYHLEERLLNGELLPVVFSVNCASGWYDTETCANPFDETSLVEALLRMPGGGAVGFLGDTRNSPSWPNSVLLRGFMDAVWPAALPYFGGTESTPRLGDILNHAKLYLLCEINCAGTSTAGGDISSGASYDELLMWHAFGDPTLELWTEWPYGIILPETLQARLVAANALQIDHETEGATVTVFRQSATGAALTPLGRGVVQQGVASVALLEGAAVREGDDLEIAVTLGNAISRSVAVRVPPDETAPANVANFFARSTTGRVSLTWENPPDEDFAGVRILRKEDGYPVSASDGTLVCDGAGQAADDTKVGSGHTYYYTAFAYDEVPNYASGAQAMAAMP
jgi:hypothetical protein